MVAPLIAAAARTGVAAARTGTKVGKRNRVGNGKQQLQRRISSRKSSAVALRRSERAVLQNNINNLQQTSNANQGSNKSSFASKLFRKVRSLPAAFTYSLFALYMWGLQVTLALMAIFFQVFVEGSLVRIAVDFFIPVDYLKLTLQVSITVIGVIAIFAGIVMLLSNSSKVLTHGGGLIAAMAICYSIACGIVPIFTFLPVTIFWIWFAIALSK